MNTSRTTIIFSIVFLVIGLIVGMAFRQTTPAPVDTMTHMMSDGTMMMDEETMNDMDAMMGMMTSSLTGKTGDTFDQAFISGMIAHHEGAVAMAEQVLATSERPELIKLANDIIAAQTAEITMMQGWETAWFK
jgi:uncharacterized protein (DUF305 family)